MSETSSNLILPYLQAAQAQKHLTHNEALERLDVIVQLTVQGFGAVTPPLAPDEGQVWALGSGAVNEWATHDGELAAWSNGGWLFVTPRTGWRAALGSELRLWDGADWLMPDLPALQTLPGVGVNTSYDATNKLAVASEAVLFTHVGAGHQVKLNKAGAGDTASLLYQSNWSGRAEMGLAGSDNWSLKVSADGSAWSDALSVAAASGAVSAPVSLEAANLTRGGSQVFSRDNILGTVSEASGLPTGAVIEAGSNANGRFVRLADGTQICSHSLTASAGAAVSWTYPAVFAAAPVVTGSAEAAVLSALCLDGAPGTSSASLSARDAADARRADVLHVTATGRWF